MHVNYLSSVLVILIGFCFFVVPSLSASRFAHRDGVLTDMLTRERTRVDKQKLHVNSELDEETGVPSMFVSKGMPFLSSSTTEALRKKIKVNQRPIKPKAMWKDPTKTKPPIILLPGIGGSQLHIKLNKTSAPLFCTRSSNDFFLAWLNIFEINSIRAKCFVDNLSIYLTLKPGGKYSFDDAEGVQVQTLDFGGTEGIDYLDPRISFTGYFEQMTEYFTKLGYAPGDNLHGAPYDFRYTPFLPQGQNYLAALKTLIETTYEANNQTKVVMIGHSYGGLWGLVFLNSQSSDWKDKYIGKWISLATPWEGAHIPVMSVLTGDAFGIPLLSPILARPMERTLPSQYALFPSSTAFPSGEPIVITPVKNYTTSQMSEMFRDLNLTQEELTWKTTLQTWKVSDMNPGVKEAYCLFGKSVKTARTFIYSDLLFDKQPAKIFGEGDGTVPIESLQSCKRFPNTKLVDFEGIDHRGIITEEKVLEYLSQILQQ